MSVQGHSPAALQLAALLSGTPRSARENCAAPNPTTWNEAHKCIANNNLAGLQILIDEHPECLHSQISEGPFKGCTLLHGAAAQGHAGIIEFLLAKGLNPDQKADTGETPRQVVNKEWKINPEKYQEAKDLFDHNGRLQENSSPNIQS